MIFSEQILRVKDVNWAAVILVGNKSDLNDQRVISTEQGELGKAWELWVT